MTSPYDSHHMRAHRLALKAMDEAIAKDAPVPALQSAKPKPRHDPLTDPPPLAPNEYGAMIGVDRELGGYYTTEQFQAVVQALEECRSRMAEMDRHIEYFLTQAEHVTLFCESERIAYESALAGLKAAANQLLKEADL